MTLSTSGARSRIRRHPERSIEAGAAEILAAGAVAHVGFVIDEQPFVIPLTFHFDVAEPEFIYLHGSRGSRLLKHLALGSDVCVTVTLLEGLVYSKTAPNHSMNYRSVVCFGQATELLDGARKRRIFEAMTYRYFPGREPGRDYEAAGEKDLSAVLMVAVRIQEWSAKQRTGGPLGPTDSDLEGPGTCGVIELGVKSGR